MIARLFPTIRRWALLLPLVSLTAAADSAERSDPKAKTGTVVLGTYPATDDGAEYRVEREGCEKENDCLVVVRLMRDGKELSRAKGESAPNGEVKHEGSESGGATDAWSILPRTPNEEAIATVITLTPFRLTAHERGLLFEKVSVHPEDGMPVTSYTAVGLAQGAVRKLWSATQADNEQTISVRVRNVGENPEIILSESRLGSSVVGRYGIFARDPVTGLMNREQTLFGVSLGAAAGEEGLRQRVSSCKAFTGGEEAMLLRGPIYPALGEKSDVAVAVTTDEKQAKTWQQQIAKCRKGKAPSVVRLK